MKPGGGGPPYIESYCDNDAASANEDDEPRGKNVEEEVIAVATDSELAPTNPGTVDEEDANDRG